MKKRSRLLRSAALALAVLTLVPLLFSCSTSLTLRSTNLSAAYTRKLSGKPAASEVGTAASGALTDATVAMFCESIAASDKGGNSVVSPLSAIMCLALIANGSRGTTRAQIEAGLGMSVEQLNRALYGLSLGLDTKNVKLKLANSIWIDESLAPDIRSDFLQTNADWYNAQVYHTPMDSTTVRDINSWVRNSTDRLIDGILNDIQDNTRMFLINALLFDAKWNDPYENDDVKDGHFKSYNGTTSSVKMLSSCESYMSCGGAQAFSRLYKGGRYAFVGILPDEYTDIYDYISSLDGDTWRALWGSQSGTAQVLLPEFKCESETDLKTVAKSLGINNMFDSSADFSGITDATALYCSDFRQKAVIKVDRNGTKAAAVSWGAMNDAAADISVRSIVLDRPFIYAVVDCESGLPLFMGVVAALS